MAPLKLEDNIREQFEGREIKPSAEAWRKLADRLDELPEKPKRGVNIWWAIAAGIAALAIVGSLLFGGDPSQPNNEMVLEEEAVENPLPKQEQIQNILIEQPQNESETVASSEETIQEEEVVEKKAPTVVKKQEAVAQIETPELIEDKSDALTKSTITEAVAATDTPKTEAVDNTEDALEAKVSEVVDKIKALETANATVTEEEIADLLEQAQRDLKLKSQIDMKTLKVDATALLMDVEYDLERSFRDKVFNALGEGYDKIRTAMATRNN